jgi:hypothetical protein
LPLLLVISLRLKIELMGVPSAVIRLHGMGTGSRKDG